MADQQSIPLQLQWGHTPDGRFFVATVLPVRGPTGEQVLIPVTQWMLTKDEEQSLMAKLTGGLVVTASIPEPVQLRPNQLRPNGRH